MMRAKMACVCMCARMVGGGGDCVLCPSRYAPAVGVWLGREDHAGGGGLCVCG